MNLEEAVYIFLTVSGFFSFFLGLWLGKVVFSHE